MPSEISDKTYTVNVQGMVMSRVCGKRMHKKLLLFLSPNAEVSGRAEEIIAIIVTRAMAELC